MRALAFVVTLWFAAFVRASELIEVVDPPQVDFAPARGEQFDLPIQVQIPSQVQVEILTADGDLVRTLTSEGSLAAGEHRLVWDGKDETGRVVPDEAYVPVLVARAADGAVQEIDPRAAGGGEVVEDLQVQTHSSGDISYTLPAPSRVLIRVGIEGGPMHASLANWTPRPAGRNVQRWNGFDPDDLVDLRQHPGLSVLVTAFRLPAPVIITYGNDDVSYRTYRLERGWPDAVPAPAEPVFERDGQRISPNYYQPRFQDQDPALTLTPLVPTQAGQPGHPLVVDAPISIRVDIPPAERWLMQEGLFEVGFFVDHEFVSEEEHGYVPFTWPLDPAGLTPGRHLLTVNISGFDGKVAAKSLLFEVPE